MGENLIVRMSWLRRRLRPRQKLAFNLPSSSARWINVVRKKTAVQMLQWPRRKPQALGTLETNLSPPLRTLRLGMSLNLCTPHLPRAHISRAFCPYVCHDLRRLVTLPTRHLVDNGKSSAVKKGSELRELRDPSYPGQYSSRIQSS